MAKAKAKAKPKASAKKKKAPAKKAPAKKRSVAKVSRAKQARAKPEVIGPYLRSLRTCIYQVHDLALAKEFYSQALGKDPYFDEPYYVGFEVGGFELGLDPDVAKQGPGPGGSAAYWGVSDLAAALAHATSRGAAVETPLQDVGGGIKVAALRDPFGNVVGLIENPHFALPPAR